MKLWVWDERDVRIDTFEQWPAVVTVRVTHVPTGIAETVTRRGQNRGASRREALMNLKERVERTPEVLARLT